jgi:hypothetical protein
VLGWESEREEVKGDGEWGVIMIQLFQTHENRIILKGRRVDKKE